MPTVRLRLFIHKESPAGGKALRGAMLVSLDGDPKDSVWVPNTLIQVHSVTDGVAEVTMLERSARHYRLSGTAAR